MSLTYEPVGLARDVREDFPVLSVDLDGTSPKYLDNAATTHKPRRVLGAMYDFYTTANSNVGRSVHTLSMRATDRYERARDRVRDFINADNSAEIVFTRGATDSLNLLAHGYAPKVVGHGDEVLISGLEHHSNLLPWRQLCERVGATLKVVPIDEHGEVSAAAFREHMTGRTRLIALAHVSNVQGTVTPVAEIVADAHRRGIVVAVDGAQAVAHRAVDVCDLDVDFYCFSGHKMYGPMGIGVLYGKEKYLQAMDPVQLGGGSAKHVTYDGSIIYMRRPQLFEVGTPNICGAVGLAAAMDYLQDLGLDRVAAHDAALAIRAADGLRALDGVRVYGAQQPVGGIVSFSVAGLHPYDVGNHLNKFGIAVRTGVHCAVPFVDSLKVVGTVRASFGVYNTAEEVDLLIDAVRTAKKDFWTIEHPHDRFLH